MSFIFDIIFILIPPIAIFAAVYAALKAVKRGIAPSRAVKRHLLILIMVFIILVSMTFAVSAAAENGNEEPSAGQSVADNNLGIGLIAAGLSTGLAGIGGGIALAGGMPAAIGATSEDPKNFSKALIFVALGETIALYGIVISVMILAKL